MSFWILVVLFFGVVKSDTIDIPNYGKFQGSQTVTAWTGRKINQYLGVPYAQSTGGENRFKTAQPLELLQGVQNVGTPKKGCPSLIYLKDDDYWAGNPEDCLHMSIYTPADVPGKLPVIVFIHGGYFDSGAAADYSPGYLLEKDVVLVVPQYRLGLFGFFSDRTDEFPGNYGLNDVATALKKIREYISYFGGDPDNITIVGYSGGAVLANLLRSTQNRDLFNKMILLSASATSPWAIDLYPEENAKDIVKAACGYGFTSADCLKSISANNLTKAFSTLKYTNYLGVPGMIGNKLVIYGRELHDHPSIYVIETSNAIPVLAGVPKHAGSSFYYDNWLLLRHNYPTEPSASTELSQRFIMEHIMSVLGIENNEGLLASLIQPDFFSQNDLKISNISEVLHEMVDLEGTVNVKSPVFEAVKAYAKRAPNSTFIYTFDYEGEHRGPEKIHYAPSEYVPGMGGVTVGDDIQYVFPRLDGKVLNEDDTNIAKLMVEMWTSFAATAKPHIPGNVEFPSMYNIVGPYLHVNKVSSIGEKFQDEFHAATRDAQNGKTLYIKNSQ